MQQQAAPLQHWHSLGKETWMWYVRAHAVAPGAVTMLHSAPAPLHPKPYSVFHVFVASIDMLEIRPILLTPSSVVGIPHPPLLHLLVAAMGRLDLFAQTHHVDSGRNPWLDRSDTYSPIRIRVAFCACSEIRNPDEQMTTGRSSHQNTSQGDERRREQSWREFVRSPTLLDYGSEMSRNSPYTDVAQMWKRLDTPLFHLTGSRSSTSASAQLYNDAALLPVALAETHDRRKGTTIDHAPGALVKQIV